MIGKLKSFLTEKLYETLFRKNQMIGDWDKTIWGMGIGTILKTCLTMSAFPVGKAQITRCTIKADRLKHESDFRKEKAKCWRMILMYR